MGNFVTPFAEEKARNMGEYTKDLKIIEKELVPVYETDKGIKVVNGRELHQVLQSGQDFSTWVKKRLAECDAVENEDYDRFHKKMEANNATMIDYFIKLDIAKEMAMLERNDKGKQVRRYFIQIEKKYKDQNKPKSSAELLLIYAQQFYEQEQRLNRVESDIKELEAKVTTHNEDYYTVAGYASLRGISVDVNKASMIGRKATRLSR